MNRILICLALFPLLCSCATSQNSPANGIDTVPKPGILVELFTSEGCSSCPPADELLRQLDAQADKTKQQIVVLSEHVDYWDHDGWRDRFSSRDYTDRQEEYARRFHTEGPYTPEMVVDGHTEFTGNDAARLQAALRQSAANAKSALAITAQEINPAEALIHLKAAALPSGSKHADLYVAVADNHDETQVGGGENSGRTLRHVAVLRSLQKVGRVGAEGDEKDVKIHLPKSGTPANLRIIAFLQESDDGAVVGAAMKALGEPIR